MFDRKTNLAVIFTIFTIFISATAQNNSNNHNNCQRRCGKQTVKYPFGFSDNCKVKLNCINRTQVKIGELEVQQVSSDSIFISLPAKCNRNMSLLEPLFGNNFAPTWNNSFLVQSCKSKLGGCVIPTTSFIGTQIEVEGCERRRNDNITCFTQSQRLRQNEDVLSLSDWKEIKCDFLFSAIAVDRGNKVKEVELQFQVVELGWWLEGSCKCSDEADCMEVRLEGGNRGFRCRCREGFVGDGFRDGSSCRRGDSTSTTSYFNIILV